MGQIHASAATIRWFAGVLRRERNLMTQSYKVIVADDHPLIRASVVNLLGTSAELDVIADVGSADEALRLTATLRPDVVVLDINMPGIDAFQAAGEVRQIQPNAKVVFLTVNDSDGAIERAKAAGVNAFVSKGDEPGDVITAIRETLAGRTYYSPTIQQRLASGGRNGGDSRLSQLSSRELETLRYVAKGLAKKEIAPLMHISVKTVDKHVTQIMTKLDIHDRVGLARYAIREGLVEA
jgi:DNA-binding NarL/FixJ family response regulator